MKARICECCKLTFSDVNKEMLYSLDITEAEGYVANNAAEKKLLLSLEDVCDVCTAKLRAAIQFILKGAKQK